MNDKIMTKIKYYVKLYIYTRIYILYSVPMPMLIY